jgi:hypothetical protein
MILNIWKNLHLWLLDKEIHQLFKNTFIFLDIVILFIILLLLSLIIIKSNTYINNVNKKRRDKLVEYMRKTSKHNIETHKKLKF